MNCYRYSTGVLADVGVNERNRIIGVARTESAPPPGDPDETGRREGVGRERKVGMEGQQKLKAGKVLLIVNVASKCGLTPQYEGLEKLYRDYRDRGLVVLGFPANDFAGQEPGSNEDIANARVRFENGCVAAITARPAIPPRYVFMPDPRFALLAGSNSATHS